MIAVLSFAFVLLPTAVISYLGSLARIMDVAAWSEEGAHRLRRDMEIGMSNDPAYEQLRSVYEPVVIATNRHLRELGAGREFEWVEMPDGGERYAAIMLPEEGEGEKDRLTELLGPIKHSNPLGLRMLADSRQRLMRTWRRMNDSGSHLEDELGDNYCLKQLHVDGGLCLDVAVATYGEIMRSSDALINEFALFAYLCGPIGRRRRPSVRQRRVLEMSPQATLRCLPWRRRVHRAHRGREHEIFLTPHDRAAGIGIAVVTTEVVKTEQGEEVTKAFLGVRSGKVGTYPATNHVVPAGMCNTYGTNYEALDPDDPPPPYYLETVMRCEFLEEWAQVTELESNKRSEWAEHVNQAWDKQIERQVTKPLRLTGVAFDLLNLRPEICATIAVDTHHGALNWEFDQIGVQGPLKDMGRVRRTEIVQGGAAALRLAQLAEKEKPQVATAVSSDRHEPSRNNDGDDWIPEEEYKAILRRVPILCVDLLPLRPDGGAVGLILRETYDGRKGWCLIGGAVTRNKGLLTALRWHLRTTLGPNFLADLGQAHPVTTIEYFSNPNLGEFYDPRKHAVALTYAASCSGTPECQEEGEALDFRWVELDELSEVEFGFGQGRVVETVLAQLGLRDRRRSQT